MKFTENERRPPSAGTKMSRSMMDSVRSTHIQAIARFKRQRSEKQKLDTLKDKVSKEVQMHIKKIMSSDSGKIDALSGTGGSNDDLLREWK